ncbi:MAG TPA: DUF1801 domain-containing protein [Pyrinomonadaceae bacterium]|nr:DUF1801 domain-containing protein [Pyrinomonadaceae bacterium]
MVKSKAATVEEYLAGLPEERREAVGRVREVILANLPEGYREAMNWGMICYEVPLERYPTTYNGQPLGYAALAAQKNWCTLYLMAAYQDSEQERRLREGFARAGLKLDMGKSCVRFRRAEDLALDTIAEVVGGTTPDEFIAAYEAARRR